MGLPMSGASLSKGSILGFDYEPVDLAPPILPQPKIETFIDSNARLRQIVSDKVIPSRPFARAYSYSPLKGNEIRLLKLEPGKPEDEIKCRMIYAPPDHPEVFRRYHALSYHWGFDRPTNDIQIIDDRLQTYFGFSAVVEQIRPNSDKHASSASKERWFSVRDNLFSALRGLRHAKKPLLLWVDAICINQTPADEEARKEKQQQVNNMAQIYSAAKSVSIWLGESTAETDQAMRFIRKLVTEIPDLDSFFCDVHKNWRDWLALRNLLTFKWFSRRWIVQEVALARDATVHCGKESINWVDFADGVALFVDRMEQVNKADLRFLKDFSKLEDIAALGANALVTILSNLSRRGEDGGILERLVGIETLVSKLLFFEASTPHDYIFALLALGRDTVNQACPNEQTTRPSPPGNAFNIEVNYEMDPLDLFRNFTEQCVKTSKSLDIICRHWAPSEIEIRDDDGSTKEVTFPSWILKVSDSSYGTALDTLQGRRGGDSFVGVPCRDMRKTYNACNGTEAICSFKEPFDECPLRRYTDLSDASNDSLSMKRTDLSGSFSRKPTLNNAANSGMDERDFAVSSTFMMIGKTPYEEPGTILQRRDSGTHNSSSPRNGSNISSKSVTLSENLLFVKGIQLGRIAQRSTRITNGTVLTEWLKITGWDASTPGQVPDMLWRTLVADRGPGGQYPPRWYRRACSHCLSDKSVMTTNADLDTQKVPESDIMAKFLARVKSVVYNRLFFVGGTKQRPLFGLAPARSEKGDLICVLSGCTVPVILRKKRGPCGICYFELIGEAYVHGYMDGEAMSCYSSNPDDLKKELDCFPLI